jgi:hypothetical protein
MEYRAGEVPVHYAVPALGLVDEAALERIGDRWQLISGPEKDRGTPPRPVYANITPVSVDRASVYGEAIGPNSP